MLARAFHDDVAWRWILPGERRRTRALPWLFRLALRAAVVGGEVDTTAGDVRGVALWVPPDSRLEDAAPSPVRALAAPRLRLGRGYGRFREYTQWNAELYRRASPGASLFLSGLGVDPGHRRRGIGGALLEAGLARHPGVPAVLLTNSAENVRFYERHGFDVVLDEPLSGSVPAWAMVRPPHG